MSAEDVTWAPNEDGTRGPFCVELLVDDDEVLMFSEPMSELLDVLSGPAADEVIAALKAWCELPSEAEPTPTSLATVVPLRGDA